MRTPRRARRGFTLMEILAATVIFAVLIGVLYSVLFGALRLRETAHAAAADSVPRSRIAGILGRDLAGAVVPAGLMAGPFLVSPEELDKSPHDSVSFYATTGVVSDSAPWGDVQQVEYFLDIPGADESQEGHVLVRRVTRNLLETTIDEDDRSGETRLIDGVASLEFACYDAGASAWLDTWDSTTVENANPAGVRMRIVFLNSEPGRRARMPLEIVVPISAQPRPVPAPAVSGLGGTQGGGGGAAPSGGGAP